MCTRTIGLGALVALLLLYPFSARSQTAFAADLPALRQSLTASDPSVVYKALLTCRPLGPSAAPLIPDLIALLGDSRDVRIDDGSHIGYRMRPLSPFVGDALTFQGGVAAPALWEAVTSAQNPKARTDAATALEMMFFQDHGKRRDIFPDNSVQFRRGIDAACFDVWVRSLKFPELRQPRIDASITDLLQELDGQFKPLAKYLLPSKLKGDSASENTDLLIPAMHDDEVRVLAMHCHALAKGPDAIPVLLTCLAERLKVGNGYPEVWAELGAIGAPAVIPLTRAIADKSNLIRDDIVWALYQIKDPAAVPDLITDLSHEDPLVRQWVANTFAALADTRAIPPLIKALKDPDPEVRRSAAWALGQIRDPQGTAVKPLVEALRSDPAWGVRMTAAVCLGWLSPDDPAVLEDLNAASLQDKDEHVRDAAAEAIRILRQKGGLK